MRTFEVTELVMDPGFVTLRIDKSLAGLLGIICRRNGNFLKAIGYGDKNVRPSESQLKGIFVEFAERLFTDLKEAGHGDKTIEISEYAGRKAFQEWGDGLMSDLFRDPQREVWQNVAIRALGFDLVASTSVLKGRTTIKGCNFTVYKTDEDDVPIHEPVEPVEPVKQFA